MLGQIGEEVLLFQVIDLMYQRLLALDPDPLLINNVYQCFDLLAISVFQLFEARLCGFGRVGDRGVFLVGSLHQLRI